MKFIELEKAEDINNALFAYIDESEIRTDFDTQKTKVTVAFFRGPESEGDKLTQIRLTLSDEYISDTYHLTGDVSEEVKIKAVLGAAKRVFDDKGIPTKYGGAVFTSQHPIVYTDDPDMRSVGGA